MLTLAMLLMAQTVGATDLRPAGFYVAGVQQGMTLAEYNTLITNGGFRSRPVAPDTYLAVIDRQDVAVRSVGGEW